VFDNLVARYFEAQIAEGIEVGDIDIIAPALVPVMADPSRRTLNLIIALITGTAIGILGAVVLDQIDSRVKRVSDAERAAGLEVVGMIPKIDSLAADSMSLQMSKDAFRSLRTHLRYSAAKQPRVLSITSATPRDGKSTVAANLALTVLDQGVRVLLIDADLRRPQVHTTFSIDNALGLSDVLQGACSLEEAIQACPEHPGLKILVAGSPTPQPTELIGSQDFEVVIDKLRSTYDFIVIDTPPLLAVTDAALVGSVVDGTLIVVRANKTDLSALENAVSQLRRLHIELLGIVLNSVPKGRSSGYAYYPQQYPSYSSDGRTAKEEKRPLLRSGSSAQKAS
jgi:capsular exopolysaccharide synthesis family protein